VLQSVALPLFELAYMLVRLDHVACCIVTSQIAMVATGIADDTIN
jgi:hypothetical protein